MSTGRPRHPNGEIERVIQYAEELGWTVRMSSGHGWGRLYCPLRSREGCIVSVWSTPRSAGNHARQVRNAIDRCPHQEGAGTPEGEPGAGEP